MIVLKGSPIDKFSRDELLAIYRLTRSEIISLPDKSDKEIPLALDLNLIEEELGRRENEAKAAGRTRTVE